MGARSASNMACTQSMAEASIPQWFIQALFTVRLYVYALFLYICYMLHACKQVDKRVDIPGFSQTTVISDWKIKVKSVFFWLQITTSEEIYAHPGWCSAALTRCRENPVFNIICKRLIPSCVFRLHGHLSCFSIIYGLCLSRQWQGNSPMLQDLYHNQTLFCTL